MTNVTRWNPWQEIAAVNAMMDRVLSNAGNGGNAQPLPMDLYETEDAYVARFSVPGLNPEQFDLTWHEQTLTVRAHTELERPEGARYHIQEQAYGAFTRSLRFPTPINGESIEANLSNGLLTVRVPKAEAAKPRKISVGTYSNN